MVVRPRLIPVLLLKHGVIVRSQLFKVHQVIGNPMSTVQRFSDWNVDELVVLDISRGEAGHDLRRDDLQQQYHGGYCLRCAERDCQGVFHAPHLWRSDSDNCAISSSGWPQGLTRSPSTLPPWKSLRFCSRLLVALVASASSPLLMPAALMQAGKCLVTGVGKPPTGMSCPGLSKSKPSGLERFS
jgi:hypothetical protein